MHAVVCRVLANVGHARAAVPLSRAPRRAGCSGDRKDGRADFERFHDGTALEKLFDASFAVVVTGSMVPRRGE
jgi:hypothetical protein